MAKCPNCEAQIAWDAERCPKCPAIFSGDGAWSPLPETIDERRALQQRLPGFANPLAKSPDGLPFAGWWPLLGGALVGVVLRLVFSGKAGGAFAPMMMSFIYLAPVLVGATTVYLAERQHRRSWWYYFWAPFLATLLFVLGTMAILIEGLVCAVVIFPLFTAIGTAGGVAMGIVCRITNWPRQTIYSLAVLPFVLGGLEGNLATPTSFGAVERTVLIHAAPETVWRHLMEARDIRPGEVAHAWIFRIGVPLPLAGVVEATPEGPVRKMRMGKDVHYDQVFAELRENRYVRWTYRLYPDSFPPYALDDHVLVGGYYFDVKDTSYTLAPVPGGTALTVRMGYRVTTQFNWYTEPLARLLLGNFEDVVLEFYRRRSER